MFDVASSLMGALHSAQADLRTASERAARAQTQFGDGRTDSAMAAVAQTAIFSEVLLNAVHARLAEIKAAAHG